MKPIYIPPSLPSGILDLLESELLTLPWETRRATRHECFMADSLRVCNAAFLAKGPSAYIPREYSYGRNDGITYTSKPFRRDVLDLLIQAGNTVGELGFDSGFNTCFGNKYDDQHQHLGWHADDSKDMDPAAPIAVMSFGAEREIWVKDKRGFPCVRCGGTGKEKLCSSVCPGCHGHLWTKDPYGGRQPSDHRYLLQRGSLFIMPPGFQDGMLHRIPKHPQPCGWRISLTFRKFL